MIRGTLQWEFSPDNVTRYCLYAIPEVVWTQKDGTEIPVSEMTTSHIVYAGRLVYQQYQQIEANLAIAATTGVPNGDAAALSLEMAEAGLMQDYADCCYWLNTFTDELLRRGFSQARQLLK